LRSRQPESTTSGTFTAAGISGTGFGSSTAAGTDAHGPFTASAGTVSARLDDPANVGFWARQHPEALDPAVDEESISALVALV
jgi:hypothetical protein